MSVPVWTLLGFAGWTLIPLMLGVAPYRWSRILTGRARINEFPADGPKENDFYRRAMRAHANCVENLPVFGAVVFAASAAGAAGPMLNVPAVLYLVARVGQTSVHLSFRETPPVVAVRFAFFLAQIALVIAMGLAVVLTV